jgi:hypothetical protein
MRTAGVGWSGAKMGGSLSSKLVLQFAGKPLAYLGRNRHSSVASHVQKLAPDLDVDKKCCMVVCVLVRLTFATCLGVPMSLL